MVTKTEIVLTAKDETRAAFQSVEAGLGKLNTVLGVFGIAVGVTTAGVAEMMKHQIDAGDELSKFSQKVGVSVESLSAYQYAAKLAGSSNEELRVGLTQLAKHMQEAVLDKGGESARTFRALGIEVVDANGKLRSTDSVFEQLSKRFGDAQDGANKTALATKLLGRSGAELIPLMNQLDELTKEAAQTGNVVSTDFAKKAEQFNDSMQRMQAASGNFARAVADLMLPALTSWIEKLNVAIGAQDQLSLQTMARDRMALVARYQELKQREEMLGFTEAFVARDKAKILADIDVLDKLIIAENKRMLNLRNSQGGENKKGELPTVVNDEPFKKLMQSLKEASGKAQTDILNDEWSKTQARVKLAESEWRFKIDQAKLGAEERKAVEAELQQYLADLTQKELAGLQEKRDKELQDTYSRYMALRMSLDDEFAAKEEQRQRLAELDAYYKEFDLAKDEEYYQLRSEILGRGLTAMSRQVAAANKQRSQMWQAAWHGDLASMSGVLGEVSGLMNSEHRKQFEIGKKAAKAQVLVNTFMAAQSGFATPPFFPVGLAMGALALALGFMNYEKVNSVQFQGGGGGSPGGAIGTFPASPNTGLPESGAADSLPNLNAGQQNAPARRVEIHLQGSQILSDEMIRDQLIPAINEAIGDGVELTAV